MLDYQKTRQLNGEKPNYSKLYQTYDSLDKEMRTAKDKIMGMAKKFEANQGRFET